VTTNVSACDFDPDMRRGGALLDLENPAFDLIARAQSHGRLEMAYDAANGRAK